MSVIIEDFSIIEKTYEKELKKLYGKKILVTGSYGMITSYLCLFLIHIMEKFDLELYLQGRNTQKLRQRYGKFEDSGRVHLMTFDFEQGEIPDIKPDYILHAASAASTKYFKECPVDVLSPNTVGTWNLLNYAKKIDSETSRLRKEHIEAIKKVNNAVDADAAEQMCKDIENEDYPGHLPPEKRKAGDNEDKNWNFVYKVSASFNRATGDCTIIRTTQNCKKTKKNYCKEWEDAVEETSSINLLSNED